MLIRFIMNVDIVKEDANGVQSQFMRPVNKMMTVAEVRATDDDEFVDIILNNGDIVRGLNKATISVLSGVVTPYEKPKRKTRTKKAVEEPVVEENTTEEQESDSE